MRKLIVWAGDGIASESYLEAARNADVLFSDISPSTENLGDTPWRGPNKELSKMFHIQSRQLAEIAVKANVKIVALHHEQNYSDPYDPDALVKEVKQVYDGEVISARDGDVF